MPATKKSLILKAQKLELVHSDIFEEWQLSLNSEPTRENYRNHLAYFCGFHNVKAAELKGKTVEELRDMCKAYLLHLKKNAKEGAGPRVPGEVHVNSLPIYMSGVKSYLDYLEKPIVWKKINSMLPEQTMSEVRAYTREEIQKLLGFANPRERAMMFIMTCGVRRGGLAALKIANFDVFEKDSNIGMVWVYARAKRWRYFTLLTPEATQAVQDYLKWRNDHGEKLDPEAPLIRDKFDVFTARRTRPRALKPGTVGRTMARLLQQASISDFRISPDHSFRHFFDTMVINANVNERFKKYWMGHKSGLGLDSRYYDPRSPDSRKALLSEFLKAVDMLTINEENS
jgi:integrase